MVDATQAAMKLSKKNWLTNLVRDLSPTSNSASKGFVPSDVTKSGPMDHIPNMFKVIGIFFAVIGALCSFKWFLSAMAALDYTLVSLPSQLEPTAEIPRDESETAEKCNINHVMSEVTNRLQLLEVAFKEQTFARESIAREITDQSDVYGILESKLLLFIEKLNNITAEFEALENKYKRLSDRVYSDEIIGALLILVIILGCVLWCRPYLEAVFGQFEDYKPKLTKILQLRGDKVHVERKNSSNPGTPKHMRHLRNEMCIIFTQRDCANSLFSNLYEAMLRHLDGVKVAVKPFYTVFSNDDLRSVPHVRLYVIIIDLETRGTYINGSEKDLIMLTVKYTKSIGAQTVVIITNDEGSKNLTAHSVYNSSIRMIKTNDCLQELAANGRLFSMWKEMTSHQLSHLRRVIKTVLNVKLTIR